MTTRFFVYGSMSEGMVHWSKISEMIESSCPATLQASAYRLKVGFPALVDEGQHLIRGQLVELRSSEILLSLLDEFHGFNRFDADRSLFHRKEVSVQTAEGAVSAFAYFLNPRRIPAGAKLIEDGDWQRSLAEEPPLTQQLTERQRHYLQKLGAATGREIIPINDMSLYRELMNLDLIVDKGRRLALSKFGQEVVHYLGSH